MMVIKEDQKWNINKVLGVPKVFIVPKVLRVSKV